jgi:hypothetical protein
MVALSDTLVCGSQAQLCGLLGIALVGFFQQLLGGSLWCAWQFAQCRRGRAGASCKHDDDAQEKEGA